MQPRNVISPPGGGVVLQSSSGDVVVALAPLVGGVVIPDSVVGGIVHKVGEWSDNLAEEDGIQLSSLPISWVSSHGNYCLL